MPSPNVYLATCAQLPEGDRDTIRLTLGLRSHGVTVKVAVWDDPAVRWAEASLTLIRSTWDYHTRRDAFVRWARSVSNIRNQASLVEWNTDKRYLFDFPSTIPIVPSIIVTNPSSTVIDEALYELGCDDGVLKPVVGLDGYGVSRVKRGKHDGKSRTGVWLLQPFVEEVKTDGETSLIVIDGRLTHTVRRLAPTNEFRVQERLGGRVVPCDPRDDIVRLAQAAVEFVDPRPLYARVDIVRRGGTPCLMELELVEPSLFFEHDQAALGSMVETIRQLIRSRD